MNILNAIIIYLIAIVVCCPCLLVVSEGNTILPNLIGLCYCGMVYRLSFTNIGKRFVKKIIKLNNYITKKL